MTNQSDLFFLSSPVITFLRFNPITAVNTRNIPQINSTLLRKYLPANSFILRCFYFLNKEVEFLFYFVSQQANGVQIQNDV